VSVVLNFLSEKSGSVAVNTLKGYITAIARRHEPVQGTSISLHPTVTQWRKGVEKHLGVTRTLVPSWNLDLVLAALKKPPFEPIHTTSNKHLTWKTVFLVALASARRASELHALSCEAPYIAFSANTVTLCPNIEFMPKVATPFHSNEPIELPALRDEGDPGLRLLCVRRALAAYLQRSAQYRREGVTQLFLCYGAQVKGQAVSKQRISKWLVECIGYAYTSRDLTPPSGVKGHQLRSQATSWAELAGASPQVVCNAATWASTCTFAKYYRLNVVAKQRSDFGRRVLQLAGSSAASRSALQGYTIPKKRRE